MNSTAPLDFLGGDSQPQPLFQRRSLNPLFVEALMGWPTGWTGFDFAATAWSPWLQHMRSEFLWLGSTMDDGLAQ